MSTTATTPDTLVRLQVVNASGVKGVGRDLAARLTDMSDGDIEIIVVDMRSFELRRLSRSMVISRQPDSEGARKLAGKLGLDPSTVAYEPLPYDADLISVTLVVGEDHEDFNIMVPIGKET